MPGGATFEFRAVKKNSSASRARINNESEFWISDEGKESVREIVTEAFREELAKSKQLSNIVSNAIRKELQIRIKKSGG